MVLSLFGHKKDLLLSLLFISLALFSKPLLCTETIICDQTSNGLQCRTYNGGDYIVFDYPKEWEYSENLIGYTESEGMNSYQEYEDYDEEVAALIFEPEPSPYEWWKFLPKK